MCVNHHIKLVEIEGADCVLLLDKYRILEDGTQTQYRLAVIESLIPPRSDGPVFHFHEMHDEGFYVTVSSSNLSTIKPVN